MPDTILITRPEPGASETAARVRALGLHPVVAPFMAIQACAAALPALGRVQAVLAASGNAVAALPGACYGLALLTVGDATAARAVRAGFADVHSAAGDAGALVALARTRLDPAAGALLLATGQRQGGTLAAALRRDGFRVHRRVVYTAHAVARFPAAATLAVAGGVQAALFFSAETAQAFARLLPQALQPALAGVDALVIGEAAAAAVSHLPWRSVRVAVRPTQDGVLALL